MAFPTIWRPDRGDRDERSSTIQVVIERRSEARWLLEQADTSPPEPQTRWPQYPIPFGSTLVDRMASDIRVRTERRADMTWLLRGECT